MFVMHQETHVMHTELALLASLVIVFSVASTFFLIESISRGVW